MSSIVKNPRTDVDVALLRSVFPDLLPDGRVVTHEQIEAVLKEPRLSARYRRVVGKWRRQLLRERGVYLDGQLANGKGFVVLTPDEMVRFTSRNVRIAGRKLKKGILVGSIPDDAALSADMKRYRSLLIVAVERIAAEHKTVLRDVSQALMPKRQLRQ